MRSFGGDVVITTAAKLVFALGGFALTVLVARELGPAGQGSFAVGLNVVLILVQAGSIGLGASIPYFVSREPALLATLGRLSLRIATVAGGVLALAALALHAALPAAFEGLGPLEVAVTVASVPLALAALYVQGAVLGAGDAVGFGLVDVVQVLTALAVVAVLAALGALSVLGALCALSVSRVAALAVAWMALRARRPQRAPARPGLLAELLRHGARVWVVTLLAFLLIRLDLVLVNALTDPADAGRYSIAVFVGEALLLVPAVVATNLLPRMARVEGRELTALVVSTMVIWFGAVCLLTVPLVAVGVPLVFGEQFAGAVTLLVLLIPGIYALGLLSPLMAHYFSLGYPRVLVGAWVAAVAGNVIANVLLLPEFGVVVAPVTSTAGYAAVFAAHVVVFGRQGLTPRPRDAFRLLLGAFGRGEPGR